jgi:Xaa-Pro aminopeptidase
MERSTPWFGIGFLNLINCFSVLDAKERQIDVHFVSSTYRNRIKSLAKLVRDGYSFYLIASESNLRYFFGYAGRSFERFSCGLISSDGEKSAIIVPELDRKKAEQSFAQMILSWTDNETYKPALNKAVSELAIEEGTIGCEDSLTLGMMESLKVVLPGIRFRSVSKAIERLRMKKDEFELRLVRNASRILVTCYSMAEKLIKPGVRECDVANSIKNFLLAQGAKSVNFCAIQSGRNGAIPHLESTPKRIERGDMVIVDVSMTSNDGYFADLTRTYSVGKASSLQREIYETVKAAQCVAFKEARIGTPSDLVDRSARRVIEEAGYGKFFIHRTGHGLGLDVHEPPWISHGNKEKLANGMVFTIEPGIYLPRKFGVRIEDDVAIEDGRPVMISQRLERDLREI